MLEIFIIKAGTPFRLNVVSLGDASEGVTKELLRPRLRAGPDPQCSPEGLYVLSNPR